MSEHDWGTRALAYEIRHKTDAEYHLLQFHGPAALLASLQRTLRITDGVVRFRIIKLAPGTPAADRAAARRGAGRAAGAGPDARRAERPSREAPRRGRAGRGAAPAETPSAA